MVDESSMPSTQDLDSNVQDKQALIDDSTTKSMTPMDLDKSANDDQNVVDNMLTRSVTLVGSENNLNQTLIDGSLRGSFTQSTKDLAKIDIKQSKLTTKVVEPNRRLLKLKKRAMKGKRPTVVNAKNLRRGSVPRQLKRWKHPMVSWGWPLLTRHSRFLCTKITMTGSTLYTRTCILPSRF